MDRGGEEAEKKMPRFGPEYQSSQEKAKK